MNHPIRRKRRAVEEVLADKKIHPVTPMLRIGLEGEPMNQKKRQGQILFEERRILRLQAKIPGCELGRSRGESIASS